MYKETETKRGRAAIVCDNVCVCVCVFMCVYVCVACLCASMHVCVFVQACVCVCVWSLTSPLFFFLETIDSVTPHSQEKV